MVNKEEEKVNDSKAAALKLLMKKHSLQSQTRQRKTEEQKSLELYSQLLNEHNQDQVQTESLK